MLDPRLASQSLSRSLTDGEMSLARALEEIFASGTHDFGLVAEALQAKCVKRPTGSDEPWSEGVLERELAELNTSLDAAYANDGVGA